LSRPVVDFGAADRKALTIFRQASIVVPQLLKKAMSRTLAAYEHKAQRFGQQQALAILAAGILRARAHTDKALLAGMAEAYLRLRIAVSPDLPDFLVKGWPPYERQRLA
jgi:hypothetical protein